MPSCGPVPSAVLLRRMGDLGMAPARAAGVDEVLPGTMKMVSVRGQAILLVNVDGTIHALQAYCSHEQEPLEDGFLFGDDLTCGLHGSRFSVATGNVLDPPATIPLRTYAVYMRGSEVWVDLDRFDASTRPS
jgi:3-phenylpropionate/trans-cinnamate dioxygenase ferredoxin component